MKLQAPVRPLALVGAAALSLATVGGLVQSAVPHAYADAPCTTNPGVGYPDRADRYYHFNVSCPFGDYTWSLSIDGHYATAGHQVFESVTGDETYVDTLGYTEVVETFSRTTYANCGDDPYLYDAVSCTVTRTSGQISNGFLDGFGGSYQLGNNLLGPQFVTDQMRQGWQWTLTQSGLHPLPKQPIPLNAPLDINPSVLGSIPQVDIACLQGAGSPELQAQVVTPAHQAYAGSVPLHVVRAATNCPDIASRFDLQWQFHADVSQPAHDVSVVAQPDEGQNPGGVSIPYSSFGAHGIYQVRARVAGQPNAPWSAWTEFYL
jgi:hypothetical protein